MILDPNYLFDCKQIRDFSNSQRTLYYSPKAKENVEKCREYLEKKIKTSNEPIYGVNTGFGSLCNIKISDKNLQDLQKNLLLSHACGTGTRVPNEIVKLMLILKIKSLVKGYSGVTSETVEGLIKLYNHNAYPIIYEQGSLGASGDLAPLAHMSLPLIGEGEVDLDGEIIPSNQLEYEIDFKFVKLKEKEGLALINGTQFMAAYGVWCISELDKLMHCANVISALSLDGFDCRTEPFMEQSHFIRPHAGQIVVSYQIRELRHDSKIADSPKTQVQDPYSFRCIPQVHGASWEVIEQAKRVFNTEINSVTDNPNIFVEEDLIISAGNFHGQGLAMRMDFLAIATAELASISERRTYKLISGERNLPLFLTPDAGLNSGYMIAQYTAASIVSQNKQLCTPASIDSIVSSNGQEDHVSMGANAATKLYKVVSNLRTVLAIELLCACQALDFRGKDNTSEELRNIHAEFRKIVPFRDKDVLLHDDIKAAEEFIKQRSL